eukprot:2054408-Pyramimonas_sp.AAC.1
MRLIWATSSRVRETRVAVDIAPFEPSGSPASPSSWQGRSRLSVSPRGKENAFPSVERPRRGSGPQGLAAQGFDGDDRGQLLPGALGAHESLPP